jgi:hypothetical protein
MRMWISPAAAESGLSPSKTKGQVQIGAQIVLAYLPLQKLNCLSAFWVERITHAESLFGAREVTLRGIAVPA